MHNRKGYKGVSKESLDILSTAARSQEDGRAPVYRNSMRTGTK